MNTSVQSIIPAHFFCALPNPENSPSLHHIMIPSILPRAKRISRGGKKQQRTRTTTENLIFHILTSGSRLSLSRGAVNFGGSYRCLRDSPSFEFGNVDRELYTPSALALCCNSKRRELEYNFCHVERSGGASGERYTKSSELPISL